MKRVMVSVSVDEYERFYRSFPDLVRDVCMIREPPLESFNDFSGELVWPESVVARASLCNEWPEIGVIDPRPKDERPTLWWREDCEIDENWLRVFRMRNAPCP